MKMLKAGCYLKIEPTYGPNDALTGVRVTGVSKRMPRSAQCIKLALSVPASVFAPFRAELEVPETAVQCSVEVDDAE